MLCPDMNSSYVESVDAGLRHIATPRRVALVFSSFSGGGVELSMLKISRGLIARGCEVDLVVGHAQGAIRQEISGDAKIVELEQDSAWRTRLAIFTAHLGAPKTALPPFLFSKPSRKLRYLPSLIRYFRSARPAAVLAATAPFNLITIWAHRLAGLQGRVVVTEHNQLSIEEEGQRRWAYDLRPQILGREYAQADAIVAVSTGLGDKISRQTGIPRKRITTVYNPVVATCLDSMASEPVDHPWLAPGQPPVILGVGRLARQKDFPTLLRAFARLRADRPVKLVILGTSDTDAANSAYLNELLAMPKELGVESDVDFAGFARNPFRYMRHAAVLVSSSAYEGLGNVIIEALACGCPVVSTDCADGPAEILDNGRFGRLVPVRDDASLAEAIREVLDSPPRAEWLQARGAHYTVDSAVERYCKLLFSERPNTSETVDRARLSAS